MINIIKAVNYQIKRDITTYIAIGGGFLIALLPILEYGVDGLKELNGGMYAMSYLSVMMFIPYIMSCLIGACIIGKDMGDKTINYEILAGHSRMDAFLARVILAFVWDIGLCILVSALPIGVVTLVNGWGNNVAFADVAARYIVNITSAFRINAFVILITMIVRHPAAGGFISYGVLNASMLPLLVLSETMDIKLYHSVAMADILYMSFISNMRQIVENGEKITVYDMAISNSFLIGAIIVPIVVSVVYVVLACMIFKKRDLK